MLKSHIFEKFNAKEMFIESLDPADNRRNIGRKKNKY